MSRMNLTPRDISVLQAFANYYVMHRLQVQRLFFPSDSDGRLTRRRLKLMLDAGLITRFNLQPFHSALGAAIPIYYLTKRGCEILAEATGDFRFLNACTRTPKSSNLHHWVAVTDTHIAIDLALAGESEAELERWINEWDTVDEHAVTPEEKFSLYTIFEHGSEFGLGNEESGPRKRRLVCAPDSAFLLNVAGYKKVFYVEEDRNLSAPKQIAYKVPGYAALAERGLHRRHFPETNVAEFSVLMIVPTKNRVEILRRALRSSPGANLWRFVVKADLTPEKFLHEPIFHRCDGEPVALLKRKTVGDSTTIQAVPTNVAS